MASGRKTGEPASIKTPLYQKLDPSRSEIRLLKRTASESGISWSFSIVSLDDKPQFTALSYVWATSDETEEIIVNNQGAAALPSRTSGAFSPNRQMFLWVDAIGINQADIGEKNSQVPLMKDIYSSAELVISWLAGPNPEITSALDMIEILHSELARPDSEILELKWVLNHPPLCESDEAVEALNELVYLDYWQRAWVFQEVVLGEHVILACGDKAMEWQVLATVAEKAHWLREKLKTYTREELGFLPHMAWGTLATNVGPSWVNVLTLEKTRKFQANHTRSGNMRQNWDLAFGGGIMLQATDPKDHIYALLGLTNLGILPDYSKETSLAAVYCDFVRRWLSYKRSRNAVSPELVFLGMAGYLRHPDLPSWVPNFPSTHVRGRGDHYIYIQPLSMSVFPENVENAEVAGLKLLASGIELETITQVEISKFEFPDVMFSQATAEFLFDFIASQSTYPTGIPPLQAVFRLFMAHAYGRGETIDEEALGSAVLLEAHIMIGCRRTRTTSLDIETNTVGELVSSFLDRFDPSYVYRWANYPSRTKLLIQLYEMLKGERPVLPDFQRMEWEARTERDKYQDSAIFITRSGFIGVSPRGTQVGDRVCILKNNKVLSVLRRSPTDDYDFYVGPCFVVGLTNEVAAERLRAGRAHISRFEMR